MRDYLKFYIDGRWVEPITPSTLEVINPATEAVAGHISMGSAADVDAAVQAARRAFESYSQSSVDERAALLERIIAEYRIRHDDIAAAITEEMGAPTALARKGPGGDGHRPPANGADGAQGLRLQRTARHHADPQGADRRMRPHHAVELAGQPDRLQGRTGARDRLHDGTQALGDRPFSAQIWTEILDAAGVPAGVFNLVNGDGPTVGAAIASHPQVDLVSFTGSTRAGIEVARNAAPTVKQVHQELGGKSPNIILPDADLPKAVTAGVRSVMNNSGQSCNAPTRMLVPRSACKRRWRSRARWPNRSPWATRRAAPAWVLWSPPRNGKNRGADRKGDRGRRHPGCRRTGQARGLDTGYYVKPTVLGDVNNAMTVAREEIFGPVLCILGYDTVEEAIAIANDTPYGLAAYVSGGEPEATRRVASRLRAGQVNINRAAPDLMAPFGGFKTVRQRA